MPQGFSGTAYHVLGTRYAKCRQLECHGEEIGLSQLLPVCR